MFGKLGLCDKDYAIGQFYISVRTPSPCKNAVLRQNFQQGTKTPREKKVRSILDALLR